MTEEPNESSPQPQIEKLLIDNPSNFQFHAAYTVYSDAFDLVADDAAKEELNRNLEDLQANKIDLSTFYMNISRYRKMDGPAPRQGGRLTVATQRKKDWRMKSQRQERMKRHKK
jgi:hypothetical protein